MIRLNPIIALIIGCIICSCLNSLAAFCPGDTKTACFTIASAINCGICIFVLYIFLTSSAAV